MNMTAIRYGEDMVVIDCGMMFPEAELLGVDLVAFNQVLRRITGSEGQTAASAAKSE
jgi:mRNA degradation ribonuclease J1/J2